MSRANNHTVTMLHDIFVSKKIKFNNLLSETIVKTKVLRVLKNSENHIFDYVCKRIFYRSNLYIEN